ncbi:MAG: TonB-dependent receptor [Candidatus Aminicenantes bacterium]|nr:TonB-dependent receptor [Candidatus Aminicenantes bacterium]
MDRNFFKKKFSKKLALFMAILFIIHDIGLLSRDSKIDKLLKMDILELSKIEVTTASKKKQQLGKVPATVRVISNKQIHERGYLTLEDALADISGFQFRNISGFNNYTFLRGAPSQNNLILVLVDGIQINELNSGGFYGGSHFNLDNVKRIEVVYGPSSVIYGTNAVSGIINIITYDPGDKEGIEINLLSGSFKTMGLSFNYRNLKEKDRTGFSFSGMYKKSNKFDLSGSAGDLNWSDNMENFEDDIALDGKFFYKDFKAGFIFQDKISSRTTNYRSEGTDYLDNGTSWHIRFLNMYINHIYKQSNNWFLKSSIYYRSAIVMDDTIAYIRDDEAGEVGQVGYYRPNDLFGLEEQFNYRFGSNLEIIGGLVLEWERLSSGFSKSYSGSYLIHPEPPDKPEYIYNQLLSIYLQSQYIVIKHLQLTAGIRYDNSDYYGEVFTPRIGLVFTRNRFNGRLLYTEAFRAPKPWDYTYGSGNTNLEPERMRSYELNLSHALSHNLQAGISIFKNSINGILTLHENHWINSRQLRTDGVEITLDYIKKRTSAYINYTYIDSKYVTSGQVPEIAPNSLNIGFTQNFFGKFKLNIRTNFLDERLNHKTITSTGKNHVNSFFVFHSTLTFDGFRNLKFQLVIRNLFDSEYYHTSNRPPERYRQPGRGLYLRVSYMVRRN